MQPGAQIRALRIVSGDAVFDGGVFGRQVFAVCQTGGTFSNITCEPDPCPPTQVPHSDKAQIGSIVGRSDETVAVVCDEGFLRSKFAVKVVFVKFVCFWFCSLLSVCECVLIFYTGKQVVVRRRNRCRSGGLYKAP